MKYSKITIDLVRRLRSRGKTYGEINSHLELKIPKSTLSFWCQNVSLPPKYAGRIKRLNFNSFEKARRIAVEMNRIKREEFLDKIEATNLPIARDITNRNSAKIALAMLCLGEASKSGTGSSFYLGSSNPKIITLFIELLKYCFNFQMEKVRCTVQCRADQDITSLEKHWQMVSGIPKKQFYKSRVDPRTFGKPTKKTEYMGVLKVDYFDRKIQLELESLSNLVYNIVSERKGS